MTRIVRTILTFFLLSLLAILGPMSASAGTDKHFLWKIESGATPSFLFGSLHLATQAIYPLPEVILKAYEECDTLVVEADVLTQDPQKTQALIQKLGFFSEKDSLSRHLSPKTLAQAKKSGLDLAPLQRFQPWLAALFLQTQAFHALGFDEKYGLDRYFLELASKNKKQIVELESLEIQFKLFTDLSPKDQDLLLYQTLAEMDELKTMSPQLIRTWKEGNTKQFEDLFFKEFDKHPELSHLLNALIFSRNRTMAAKIEDLVRSGRSCFIVVGAGHLVGDRSIVELLKNQKFSVKQK